MHDASLHHTQRAGPSFMHAPTLAMDSAGRRQRSGTIISNPLIPLSWLWQEWCNRASASFDRKSDINASFAKPPLHRLCTYVPLLRVLVRRWPGNTPANRHGEIDTDMNRHVQHVTILRNGPLTWVVVPPFSRDGSCMQLAFFSGTTFCVSTAISVRN